MFAEENLPLPSSVCNAGASAAERVYGHPSLHSAARPLGGDRDR